MHTILTCIPTLPDTKATVYTRAKNCLPTERGDSVHLPIHSCPMQTWYLSQVKFTLRRLALSMQLRKGRRCKQQAQASSQNEIKLVCTSREIRTTLRELLLASQQRGFTDYYYRSFVWSGWSACRCTNGVKGSQASHAHSVQRVEWMELSLMHGMPQWAQWF